MGVVAPIPLAPSRRGRRGRVLREAHPAKGSIEGDIHRYRRITQSSGLLYYSDSIYTPGSGEHGPRC